MPDNMMRVMLMIEVLQGCAEPAIVEILERVKKGEQISQADAQILFNKYMEMNKSEG